MIEGKRSRTKKLLSLQYVYIYDMLKPVITPAYRDRIGSINVISYQIEAAHSRANMMKIEIRIHTPLRLLRVRAL